MAEIIDKEIDTEAILAEVNREREAKTDQVLADPQRGDYLGIRSGFSGTILARRGSTLLVEDDNSHKIEEIDLEKWRKEGNSARAENYWVTTGNRLSEVLKLNNGEDLDSWERGEMDVGMVQTTSYFKKRIIQESTRPLS